MKERITGPQEAVAETSQRFRLFRIRNLAIAKRTRSAGLSYKTGTQLSAKMYHFSERDVVRSAIAFPSVRPSVCPCDCDARELCVNSGLIFHDLHYLVGHGAGCAIKSAKIFAAVFHQLVVL